MMVVTADLDTEYPTAAVDTAEDTTGTEVVAEAERGEGVVARRRALAPWDRPWGSPWERRLGAFEGRGLDEKRVWQGMVEAEAMGEAADMEAGMGADTREGGEEEGGGGGCRDWGTMIRRRYEQYSACWL